MSYFTKDNSVDAVVSRLTACQDPRTRDVMTSLITHLHSFVKDVNPSGREWMQAIEWLTATGQMCDDKRQEWILASDVLGVSMLVETLNNSTAHGETESTVLGPFHVEAAPHRDMGDSICLTEIADSDLCLVEGQVTNVDGQPVAGAVVDVWQTDAHGFYDVQQAEQPEGNMRGVFTTDADGRYAFTTTKPVSYSIPTDGPVGVLLASMGRSAIRPAHIHFWVRCDGYSDLITHIFLDGDPHIASDPVFGVKESLIYGFEAIDPAQHGGASWRTVFNPVLGTAE